MKSITQGVIKGILIVATAAALLATTFTSLAIEGLTISIHCPDVILGWPSSPGETYTVQWRPTLDPITPWTTLTNGFQAESTTSWTFFAHSNQVACPAGGGSGNIVGDGGDGLPPSPTMTSTSVFSEPLAMPADGSGSAVPLILYPPGYDFSQLLILDPSTGSWTSGMNYSTFLPSLATGEFDGPQTLGDAREVAAHPRWGFIKSCVTTCIFAE